MRDMIKMLTTSVLTKLKKRLKHDIVSTDRIRDMIKILTTSVLKTEEAIKT